MLIRIRTAVASLTPTQAAIVLLVFIGSSILAALVLWGFTKWNKRQGA